MISCFLDFLLLIIFFLIMYKDIKDNIIPDSLTLGIFLLALMKILFVTKDFETGFLGMGTYPIVFLFIYGYVSDFLKKEVVGFGDIKLLAGIGFYLGYRNLYCLIIFYNIIFILSFLYIIPYFFKNKVIKNQKIAFAPFICIGAIIFYLGVYL